MEQQTLQSKFENDLDGSDGGEFKVLNESISIVKKWNWDYPKALEFQKLAHKYVYEDPSKVVLILCNHPTCFTMGRGLQKKSGKTIENLVETSIEESQNFPYPVYKINRGGGLTYHYPGQLIFYPILNLGGSKPSLSQLAKMIFQSMIDVVNDQSSIEAYENSGDLIGLWVKSLFGEKKIASFGIGIERFITQHGVALNIEYNEVFDFLKTIYPCGLNGNTYSYLNELTDKKMNVEKFQNYFLESFLASF